MIKKSMLGVVSAREMFCPDGSITTHTEKNKVRRTRPVDVILILADQKARPLEVWNKGSTLSVISRP